MMANGRFSWFVGIAHQRYMYLAWMFLTRMGNGSKIVVSGDITQIDLPKQTRSGLVDGLSRLRGIRGFAAVELTSADIVRHPLVQEIVNAYDRPRKKRH